jgi:hypothetical protein
MNTKKLWILWFIFGLPLLFLTELPFRAAYTPEFSFLDPCSLFEFSDFKML